jgi:MutS domain V
MAVNFIADLRLLWMRLQPWFFLSHSAQNQKVNEHGPTGQEYSRRLQRREKQLANVIRRHRYLWMYFAGTAVATCFAVYLALVSHFIPLILVVFPVTAAAIIIRLLARNSRGHDRLQRVIRFYRLGMARLRGEWQGRGIQGAEFKKKGSNHYAADLNLFGRGSLFELLCTARTGIGQATLAGWLLQPAQGAEILARQEAVRELRDKLDFQEDWASVGSGLLDDVDSSSLREWAKGSPTNFPILSQVCAVVLPVCLVTLLALAVLGVSVAHWMLGAALILEGVLAGLYLRKTRDIAANIIRPSFELTLLGPLLKSVESGDFDSSLLKALQSQLTHLPTPPSRQIRTLSRLAFLMDLRQTDLAIFLAPLLTSTNLAIRIERWRRRNQEALLSWLHALGQFEALLCLARHYHENREWVFPILRPGNPALFHGRGLGHPLLDSGTRVIFDLDIGGQRKQLVIVSGSNMSGKSTLLRSVGANAVLALAGSPVCARQLEISAFSIACSISVQDSLQDDRSRFQAEVERLKEVLDTARAKSTLFLLDEMLGGTNSKDRLYGAQAVINELMGTGAIGIITTHDLALTEIGNQFDGRVSNVHFEEHYVEGEMRFDYKMLPGVLTRTNGVNVMAALGLLPRSEHSDSIALDSDSQDER